MSVGAIVMMVIGCGGLWGGFAVSCGIAFRHSRKEQAKHPKS